MCGVIGYVGSNAAPSFFYNGLKRLEYRGYDSAGIAVQDQNKIKIIRAEGKLSALEQKLSELPPVTTSGIGHTRWATHGKPSEENAHPHSSGPFVLLHNGIIENYQALKNRLEREGYTFRSETDTEVAVHLLDSEYKKLKSISDPVLRTKETIFEAVRYLHGAYAFAILSEEAPKYLFAVKQGSPLVLGRGSEENYLASGIPALVEHTQEVCRLEDGDVSLLTKDSIEIFDHTSKPVERQFFTVATTPDMLEKDGFDYFMQKEVFQHAQAVRAVTEKRLLDSTIHHAELQFDSLDLSETERIQCLACGTSYYACMVGKYLIESHAGIPVDVDLASEFRYRPSILSPKTLAVAVSQSGETIDTLFALKYAREQGAQGIALVNSEGSSIEHEADLTIPLRAGVEIGVASTKAFSAQMAALVLLGLGLSEAKGGATSEERELLIQSLLRIPQKMETTMEYLDERMRDIALELRDVPGFLYMGRGISWPVAQEGALKIRELAYVFAEAYAGGELKHGSIALIDKDSWIVAVSPRDQHFEKTMSNIAEVKARGGRILAIGSVGDSELESISDHFIGVPTTSAELSPFLTTLPLHLFAYWVARHKGNDVDQPRNLAKSVTVE